MCLFAFTLLFSRCEATLQSIISESSCTDQYTLCLVIIFRALWSASSCAGVRFFGSLGREQAQSETTPKIHTVHFLFISLDANFPLP